MKKHRGEWLALERGTYRVVGHSKSRGWAKRKALSQGIKNPQLLYATERTKFFVAGIF